MSTSEQSPKSSEQSLQSLESIVKDISKFIEKLPDFIPQKAEICESLNNLRSAIQSYRPPRIMVIGITNSGKSSLINAICNLYVTKVSAVRPQPVAAEWKDYYHNGVSLFQILDTEGFQAMEAFQGENTMNQSFQSILNAVKKNYPDVILFVHPAHSVNAGIRANVENAERIVKHIFNCHHLKVPVLGVLTQADRINPTQGLHDPDSRKRKNIKEARDDLYGHLQQNQILKPVDVIPVCSYVEFEDIKNGFPIPDTDERWNIDQLIEAMIHCTGQEAKMGIARISNLKEFRLNAANQIVNCCAAIAAIASSNPIPGISAPMVGSLQAFMVGYIAWLGGYDFSEKTIENFLGVGALGIAGITDVGLKLIPGVGIVLSATANAATTHGLGKVAIGYFLKNNI
ncbi:GTPase [Spirulina sp. CCNP1310]|uniref:GTPase n=1 Tax=Spirulina sp. CCNP1310 TaxID=3110249 RepID=UPI002B216587|nr:GTPase [Spirulina sp. CCNP1310]MEA5418372.1 GTPase [Spirulina sp. CCNP1310]